MIEIQIRMFNTWFPAVVYNNEMPKNATLTMWKRKLATLQKFSLGAEFRLVKIFD